MRHTWTVISAFLLLLALTPLHAFDSYHIIKITDFNGEKSYQVMNRDELKAFEKTLRAEGRVFSKAYSQAKKEWQSNPETKKITFPSMKPRRFSKSGNYKERADAAEKLQRNIQSAEESAKERAKQKGRSNRGKKLTKEEMAEEKKKIEDRQKLEDSAYQMVVSKINSALTEQGITPIAQTAPTTMKKTATKGKGGPVQATVTGKIKKAGKTYYLSANEGQLVNGLIPWGIDLPGAGVKDSMVGKEATITFSGTGAPKGPQIKITSPKITKLTIEGNDLVGGGDAKEEAAPKDAKAK